MAVKPLRIQAKQVYAFIGSTPTRRIQSFDWSSNFTTEEVFELGNAGIVEDSVSLVETNITVNSNEWGTTDVEAMMFNIFEQRNILTDSVVAGVTNSTQTLYVGALGAGGPWSAIATGDYVQVIRFNSNATTYDSEYVEVVGHRANAASICNRLVVSPALTAVPVGGDVITLINKYTITEDTVDSDPTHIVLPHRYSSSATTMMHSVLLPRAYVDNLTYNLDTAGASEQNYTLVGEEERFLLNAYRETQSITGSFISYSSAGGTVTFRIPKSSLAATGTPYALYAGSNLVSDTKTAVPPKFNHTSGQVTVVASIGAGLGLDSTTQLVYYFANDTKLGYKALTNIDNTIGKLTKGRMVVNLQYSTATVEQLLRCTGISINIPLTRESIDELGTSRSIGKPLEGNLRNEVTLTFNRNDLREYAKLLGSQEAFDAGTLNSILMTDLKASKLNNITVQLYKHETTHDATTLLKTLTFNNCNFIGDNSTTPISGASGLELTFSSQTISIVGSGLPPTLT